MGQVLLCQFEYSIHRRLIVVVLLRFCHICLMFKEFVPLLNLKSGERVVDVGAGIGGSAFYMAEVSCCLPSASSMLLPSYQKALLVYMD